MDGVRQAGVRLSELGSSTGMPDPEAQTS